MHAKAFVDGLGKNYANLQTVVKICQLFISELSTVIDSTNQILIPGAGIMEWRHQWNVYRLPCALPSPPGRYRFIPLALDCTWPAISKGSLFAGYDRKVVFPKFVFSELCIVRESHLLTVSARMMLIYKHLSRSVNYLSQSCQQSSIQPIRS